MLQSIHGLAKSWIFKGLMLLLVVSFSIWGIGDMFRSNPGKREVAIVGGIKISALALESRFEKDLPRLRQMFGGTLTAQQARQFGFLEHTLEMMIEETLYDLQAQKLGLNVSSAYILDQLGREPSLRDESGHFNRQMWQQALSKMGLTEKMFFELERHNMARQLVLGNLMANIEAPKTIIDHLYQARGAMRILEVITLQDDLLKHDNAQSLQNPDEETLRAWYAAHESDFTAPDYRAITIARLSAADRAENINVTEEELQKAYEARREAFKLPPSRDLVQVVLQDEEAAKALLENALKQSSLTKAAREAGLTPIVMTRITEDNILPELYAPVFSLITGETSNPIKSSLGWHIVKISSIYESSYTPLSEVKDDLRKIIQSEKSANTLSETLGAIDDALAAGQSLEDVAETFRLHLTRFAAVDDKGQDAAGHRIEDFPAPSLTLRAAQDLEAQEISEILDDGKGQYYIVRVDQVTPSALRPFESVQAEVAKIWRAEMLRAHAENLAQNIAKSLREGTRATNYAALPGVGVKLSRPISYLGTMDPDVPQAALAEIFQMKKGDVIVAQSFGRHYVLRLSDIVPVDPQKPEASRQVVIDDMKDKMGLGLIDQYSAYLRTIFPVKINKDALNELKNRDNNAD
ncbi:MAG: SurA N-terminal domain-containing protein [Alphaproteobacteria bacterium]|nr:SurA N-terminal domain-containing protein [Alphaproteobacteria bacterium]